MSRTVSAIAAVATIAALTTPVSLGQIDVVESTAQAGSDANLYPTPRGSRTVEESLYPQPGGTAARPAREALRTAPTVQQSSAGNAAGDLFFQVQALQEELMALRGLVEEHEQTILQLKQQRLDDYMNLDRRIADLGANPDSTGTGSGFTSGLPGETTGSGSVSDRTSTSSAPAQGAEDSYRAAYELVRNRQFPEATAAFEAFVARYQGSELTPNAFYWLGELYMLDGRNDAAGQRFEALLKNYPDNRKAPDAMFKLAKVYHIEGRNSDARKLLERVGTEYAGSSAARLAGEYLQQNF